MSRSGAEEQHVVQLLGVQRPDSSPASRRKLPSDAPGRAVSAAAAGAPSRRAWPTAAAAEVGAGSGALPRRAAPAGCWPARAGLAKTTRSTAFRVAPGCVVGGAVRSTNFGPPFRCARGLSAGWRAGLRGARRLLGGERRERAGHPLRPALPAAGAVEGHHRAARPLPVRRGSRSSRRRRPQASPAARRPPRRLPRDAGETAAVTRLGPKSIRPMLPELPPGALHGFPSRS